MPECAKLRRSRAIMDLVVLVSQCHLVFVGPKYFLVGISWVEIFFYGCFVGSKFFLVGTSCVQFRGSKIFSRRCFVGPKVFLAGLSCVQSAITFNIIQ